MLTTGVFQTTELFPDGHGGKTALTCTLQGDAVLTVERDVPYQRGLDASILRETFNFQSLSYTRQLLNSTYHVVSTKEVGFDKAPGHKITRANELKSRVQAKRKMMQPAPRR